MLYSSYRYGYPGQNFVRIFCPSMNCGHVASSESGLKSRYAFISRPSNCCFIPVYLIPVGFASAIMNPNLTNCETCSHGSQSSNAMSVIPCGL